MTAIIFGAASLPVALVVIAAVSYAFGNADLGRLYLTWGLIIGVLELLAGAAVAYSRR